MPKPKARPQSPSGSVRLSETAQAYLAAIVEVTGESKAAVLERSLAKAREELFWAQMNEGYAQYGETIRQEASAWDVALQDGLAPEKRA